MISSSVKLCCIHLENKIQEEGSLIPRNMLQCVLYPACLCHLMSQSSVWSTICSHLASLLPGKSLFLLWYCLEENRVPSRPAGAVHRAVCCSSFLLFDLLKSLSMLHQMMFCQKPWKAS